MQPVQPIFFRPTRLLSGISFLLLVPTLSLLFSDLTARAETSDAISRSVLDPQDQPADSRPLSGIVVDTPGAVFAGAAILVRGADYSVEKATRSDRNGSFIISG